MKVFYMDNSALSKNDVVKAGDPLGPAQDVQVRHGPKMLPHIHYEGYRNGKLIDPATILP